MKRLVAVLLIFTMALITLQSCATSPPSGSPVERTHEQALTTTPSSRLLADFESPIIPITPKAGSVGQFQVDVDTPVPVLTRSSNLPQAGLWAGKAVIKGGDACLYYAFSKPGGVTHGVGDGESVRGYDTVSIQCRYGGDIQPAGQIRARDFVIDKRGKVYAGDWYPLYAQWFAITLDLASAAEAGVDLDDAGVVGVEFSTAGMDAPAPAGVEVYTDTWELTANNHAYVGLRLGVSRTFYVERQGTRVSVGQVGRFEMTFMKRSNDPSAPPRAWMEVRQGEKGDLVLGQPGTGLAMLDQDQVDRLGDRLLREDGTADATSKPTAEPGNLSPWPGTFSTFEWAVAWSSPVAALVEVRQTSGPFDRLGRPAVDAMWRFMIYRTGEVFVSVTWQVAGKVTDPAAVALMLDRSAIAAGAEAPKDFLRGFYPPGWAQKVLPHEMQNGAAVAMFAKTMDAKESWWQACTKTQHVFGVTIPKKMHAGPVACMLLINSPTALDQVSAFSSYLSPAGATMKIGTLDTTFPGDYDNDSLVESYGFQTIRMTDGRAWFTLEPGERPIFYPTLLLTIPAVERERMDLTKFNLLINVDGQQVVNPPRWPDGSFLVQLPYIVSKPVRVEATLTPK